MRLNQAQRIVLVVALGAALATLAITQNRLWGDLHGGWFAYAPNTGVIMDGSESWPTWRAAIVWLVAIVIWASASLWLLRPGRPAEPGAA
jgi:hypothetical protein